MIVLGSGEEGLFWDWEERGLLHIFISVNH